MDRPQAVAMSASAMPPETLVGGKLLVADEAEGSHDAGDGAQQSQERGQGDEGAEHPLQAFAAFEFASEARSCMAPRRELWALSRPSWTVRRKGSSLSLVRPRALSKSPAAMASKVCWSLSRRVRERSATTTASVR